jgi:nucleoside-diphosphate-sugar epimerase
MTAKEYAIRTNCSEAELTKMSSEGWAKRILEYKAKIYMRETGIPITIVRPFNIYGERYNWVGQNSQAIPMLTKKICDREDPIIVWGSGEQRRTYIHAEDAARIMMRFVENGFTKQPINIGLEETISVKELVKQIAKSADIDVNLVFDKTKPEGRLVKSADSKLMKQALGKDFKIEVDIEEGLKRMVNWYKETFTMEGTKEKIKKLKVKSHKNNKK